MNRAVLVAAGVVLAAVLLVMSSALYTVQEGRQAIVLQFGEPIGGLVSQPGLKWKLPFVQNVVYFDKRVLDFDAERAEMATADQKQVEVDAYARYTIEDPLRFFQTVNNERNLNARLLSIISSNLRTSIAEMPLAQVLTEERVGLMQRIKDNTNIEAKTFGINVIDVRIKRVDLPEENSEAIFRRMQTQREQEARRIRAEGVRDSLGVRADADKRVRVIIAEAQKRAQILRGEGEMEATRIYNDAYSKDPAFFDFFRSLQAMSKGLSGENTRYVGPPDSEFFRFFGSMTGAPTPKPGAAAPAAPR